MVVGKRYPDISISSRSLLYLFGSFFFDLFFGQEFARETAWIAERRLLFFYVQILAGKVVCRFLNTLF
jgi:hypothetical protein